MDLSWTSQGGTLLDGSGDLALSSPRDSLIDMIRTRLKTSLDGWKQYRIGADLKALIGQANDFELQTAVARQISNSLNNQLMPPGTFSVKVVPLGPAIQAYVYVGQTLIASVSFNRQNRIFRVT